MILKIEHASFGFRKDEELFHRLNFCVKQSDGAPFLRVLRRSEGWQL